MVEFYQIFRFCLYPAFAIYIFIKHRKNIIGQLAILWFVIRGSRTIFYHIKIAYIKSNEMSDLAQYMKNFSNTLKAFDFTLALILVVICMIVISKIIRDKKQERQQQKEEAILKEVKQKNIIK